MQKFFYPFLVFSAGACYGVLSTFVKFAYDAGFHLSDVSGTQCLFGMLFLWMAVFFTGKGEVTKKQGLALLLSGIPMALTTIFYYHSLETLSASMAVVFLFQSIWMGSVAEALISRKFPTPKKLISIILCLLGTALAAGLEDLGNFTFSSGMVWGFLSALAYAAVITLSSYLGKGFTPAMKGALLATGDAILTFLLLPPVFLLTPGEWTALLPYALVLGFFGVALPPFLLAWGMPHVGPGLGSILTASEMPVSLLLALFVLGESISPIQGVGIVSILAGIAAGNMEN